MRSAPLVLAALLKAIRPGLILALGTAVLILSGCYYPPPGLGYSAPGYYGGGGYGHGHHGYGGHRGRHYGGHGRY